jgi:hypothetical protein
MLRQPDILVVPEPGRMIAVFVYYSTRELSWRSSLAALEDLFELKLNAGPQTIAACILISGSERPNWEVDQVRLLRNTFETVLRYDRAAPSSTAEAFADFMADARPNRNLFYLWQVEAKQTQVGLGHFNEKRYQLLVDKSYVPERQPEWVLPEKLQAIARAPVRREHSLQNVKGFIGGLELKYVSEFDYGIADKPDIGIDKIHTGRSPSRETIHYLMMKARLLRYVVDGYELRPRPYPLRLILIVEGNIAGPDYDPFRYVRNLVSVGWELFRADHLEDLAKALGQ